MRFLADENFNNKVLDGLRAVLPDADIVRAQDIEIYKAPDPKVLEWAANNGCVLLTHDIQTMVKYAYDRVRDGLLMPGVIEVNDLIPIGQAIEELSLMIGASTPDEFENQVKYIPIQ